MGWEDHVPPRKCGHPNERPSSALDGWKWCPDCWRWTRIKED